MPAYGSDFLSAALGPRGCAPLGTPAGGAPLHRTPYKRLRRPCRGPLAEGQGCRGKSAPDTLPAGLGRSGRVKGPCPRPCGAAGRTNPLTRPALEKPPQARAGAWDGAVGVDGGQGSRSDRAAAPALTPRNDPTLRAGGWGCFSPSRLPRGERPRRAVGDDLAFEPLGFSNPRATASGARSEAPRVETHRRGVTPCS